MKQTLLAWLCRVCPFCIVARWYPESAYARKLRRMEANCPACKAHWERYGQKK